MKKRPWSLGEVQMSWREEGALVPGTLAPAPAAPSQPVIRAAALRAAPRLPVSPDFLKPPPRYTDRAEQVGQLY